MSCLARSGGAWHDGEWRAGRQAWAGGVAVGMGGLSVSGPSCLLGVISQGWRCWSWPSRGLARLVGWAASVFCLFGVLGSGDLGLREFWVIWRSGGFGLLAFQGLAGAGLANPHMAMQGTHPTHLRGTAHACSRLRLHRATAVHPVGRFISSSYGRSPIQLVCFQAHAPTCKPSDPSWHVGLLSDRCLPLQSQTLRFPPFLGASVVPGEIWPQMS